MPGAAESGLGQQPLDDHFRLLVFAFADVVMPDPSLGVGEVERGPVVAGERTPDRVFVIEPDRVVDPRVLHGPADVPGVVLEGKPGGVHTYDGGIGRPQARR
jgi:hypothetical protein